jgi:hypothetical protein
MPVPASQPASQRVESILIRLSIACTPRPAGLKPERNRQQPVLTQALRRRRYGNAVLLALAVVSLCDFNFADSSAPYLRRRSRHPTPHLLAFDGSGHVIVIFVAASGSDQLLHTALVS